MTNEQESCSPYFPVLIETLQTMIMPGHRVRLSPFVESAQFQVLFSDKPDPKKFHSDMRRILRDREQDIEELAHCWCMFIKNGKKFSSSIYQEEPFQKVYLAYYVTTNVCKLQLALIELIKKRDLPSCLNILDIGVGAGTTAIAVLDFFIAWAHACKLYGAEFPIKSVQLIGLDSEDKCLEFARDVIRAYGNALELRREPGIETPNMYDQVLDWIHHAQWKKLDLNQQTPNMQDGQFLIVASNVLNELDNQGKQNIGYILSNSEPGDIGIIIEPGSEKETTQLNKWRRRLLETEKRLVAISPCEGMYHQCDQCWNARRESLHQPFLYKKFRQAADRLEKDNRNFSDFDNDLLSWSYTLFLHSNSEERNRPESFGIDDIENSEITMRYVGSFVDKEPAAYEPDGIHSEDFKEYLKLCPGNIKIKNQNIQRIAIEREPGFEKPLVNHGEKLSIKSMHPEPYRREKGVLKLTLKEHTQLKPICKRLGIQETFLTGYSEQVRQAIDEISYRFFGFPEMHPFQHKILERVLTGGSILAIAVTGGGKSECFILPAMLLPGVTIVVSPLKSLMQDQYEQRICYRYGLGNLTTYINGDVDFIEREARLKRMELGYYKLVYLTPEQLERNYVLNSLKQTNERIGIRYLALDEAHCISQWGHDFRPSYLNIVRRLKDRDINPVIIALTATASPNVRNDVCEELQLSPSPLDEGGDVYVHASNRPELNLIVRVENSTDEKITSIVDDLEHLLRENNDNNDPGAAIVFMPHRGGNPDLYSSANQDSRNSQRGRLSAGVTPFSSYLERKLQTRVSIYHSGMQFGEIHKGNSKDRDDEDHDYGDMKGRERQREQSRFINDEREIMVATKGFGMGIDKANIRYIIHRTPPANLEAYAQEAGRAGRDGRISDVILYYSPDSPEGTDNWDRRLKIPSDYDIQKYFLDDRYIRRQDVIVMREFLKTVERKIGDRLYFTNDEAISFLDNHGESYSWPKFQKRESRSEESEEHERILDRGHEYNKKTNYLDRILKVLYRIRPDLHNHRRCAFLEQVSEPGAHIVGLKVLKPEAILKSSSYFGRILRDKGITNNDFRNDLTDFAEYLELSLNETAALFWDMKNAEGFFDAREHWIPELIDFTNIIAPKYGPAKGKESLSEWRDYAGAKKRANTAEAYRRAREKGHKIASIDDWFGKNELSDSKGWEVLPGPAFYLDKEFAPYLEAFMDLHDRREQNDRAAYGRLLTDYVGVNEDGGLRSRQNGNCLRAVLLGYLDTNEVVVGDNCFSCSRCVSNSKFEQDIEKRKSRVVHTTDEVVIELLATLRDCSEQLPPVELANRFWESVEAEQAIGHSMVLYVEGWSIRLLDDTPGHRAAIWLRVSGMVRGLFELQPSEFIDNCRQVLADCSQEELGQLWSVLKDAHIIIQDKPEIYSLQASTCHRLEEYQKEEKLWKLLLTRITEDQDLLHMAHASLAELYAPDGQLSSLENYRIHALEAVRSTTEVSTAVRFYEQILKVWDWDRVQEEIEWCEQNNRSVDIYFTVLESWLELNSDDDSVPSVCLFLTEADRYRKWPIASMTRIIEKLPVHFLSKFEDLARLWLSRFDNADNSIDPITREKLRTLVYLLQPGSGIMDMAHKIWMRICHSFTEEILPYMQHCLTLDPPVVERVDECLDLFLDQENPDYRGLVNIFPKEATNQYGRLGHVVTLATLMNEIDNTLRIDDVNELERHHFLYISKVFEPEHDISRADMLAALLSDLTNLLNFGPLILIDLLIQCLCYARRFEEADSIASKYPTLRIGNERESAKEFINRLLGDSRNPSSELVDYKKVIKNTTDKWRSWS